MSTVPLVALKALTYAGRRYGAGDEFHARGLSDARVLIAIGSADFATADDCYGEASAPALTAVPSVPPPPEPAAAPAMAAPVQPEPEHETAMAQDDPAPASDDAEPEAVDAAPAEPVQPPAEQTASPEPRPRRTYRRRDLQSEGGGT